MAQSPAYPLIDFHSVAEQVGVDLETALAGLRALYADIDKRNAQNTAGLNLPCHSGCDACCHESVFLTPLEFYGAWDWVQKNVPENERTLMIEQGLEIYAENETTIVELNQPAKPGGPSHDALAKTLKFRCPLLRSDGLCGVYPMRELLARLFGCSFNSDGGVYGCHLVGTHLAGKLVTLLPADTTAKRIQDLPFTHKRQVYPYYIHQLYG
ncbi:MAG: hypothetical protein HOI23_16605 [Deltaproteobacteria bacterium]|nr:hypothetical protein [Deltaproteobacteria bacterium]MBT6432165.1 hypothetical protein [Deltaproteobacteria bacterium]